MKSHDIVWSKLVVSSAEITSSGYMIGSGDAVAVTIVANTVIAVAACTRNAVVAA
ncbi:hypothetical protein L195_g042291 [Trifolium pratense]|uniref:Uncharacterized protein n=1 Tax=Trifolium pratense TaxID=57577 RepID=A0A2K3M612_TRIPR|nr:hypothetical protein L195_g042291 [Trifolium pratense]